MVGTDSASAIAMIAAQQTEAHGSRAVVQPHRIEVRDRNGKTPDPRFYLLNVIDSETGIFMHGAGVITTRGHLFHLHWCPD